MNNVTATQVALADPSQVGQARRSAVSMAGDAGFDEVDAGKVAIAVTELASNIVRHAGGGEILLRAMDRAGTVGIEILGLDQGPGMTDVGHCLVDGVSTGGTPGTGLGAIARLSGGDFDVDSRPGFGSVVAARFWPSSFARASRYGPFDVGAVCVPYPGEIECGDAWEVDSDEHVTVMVVDGLGHGPFAAEAARAALAVFRANPGLGLPSLMDALHEGLKGTRGAAVGLARIEPGASTVRFVGIGNVAGTVVFPSAPARSMVSHGGIVGHGMRKVQEFEYPWDESSSVALCSDGLGTRWRLESYAGLAMAPPSLIAGVLYRDFKRGRDDATAVVVKRSNPPWGTAHA